ncbi:MAG TPA: helix-turn-helix domain-containing protein [Solirubrobacteraceae bacterium]|nr:helix-turn-helix domain-containing protein [Solirubrobacteraceae bacterium]
MLVDSDPWTELVSAIEGARGGIQRRISVRLREELPAYGTLPEQTLREAGAEPFERLLVALRDRRPPDLGSLADVFRQSGGQRAREGVPVAEMLQTMRIAMDEVRRTAERLAPEGPSRDALLLQLSDIVLAWRDAGTIELARGHRAAELDAVWREAHHRSSLVEAVLFGGLPPAEIRARVEAYGLDPDASYHAVRARPLGDMRPREVEHLLGAGSADEDRQGLVAWIRGDVCGFVRELPRRPLPIAVGTAEPAALPSLHAGFRLASRALETVLALGRAGVHDVASLGLRPAVLADPDVGEAMDARYVRPFERRGAAGAVILDTVEQYLRTDRRLAETAEALCVHTNTVRYRLARFEESTESSLRGTESLAEIWWALERRRLRRTPPP